MAAHMFSLIGGAVGLVVAFALMVGSLFLTYERGFFFLVIGIWCLFCSVMVLFFADELKTNPTQHTKWGSLILVFSVLGLGSLLGFVGGILALTYKPQFANQLPPPPQDLTPPIVYPQENMPQPQVFTRACPHCGWGVGENDRFCRHCGNSLS
jgi:hypothetical protein